MLDSTAYDSRREPSTLRHWRYSGRVPRIVKAIVYGPYGTSWTPWSQRWYYDNVPLVYLNNTYPVMPWNSASAYDNAIIKSLQVDHQELDLPLFLFELRDFPRMLRDLGRVLKGDFAPSTVPGGYLAYKFGWAPLVSDLMSLLSLAGSFENRINYLLRIQNGVGKRISRKLHTEERVEKGPSAWYNDVVKYQKVSDIKTTVWFTCRIGDLDDDVIESLLVLYRRARSGDGNAQQTVAKALTGLRVNREKISTVWNAIPWSWLIDYFISIGDFIEAYNAVLPFKPRDVCLMYKTEALTQYELIEKGYYLNRIYTELEYFPGECKYLQQERYPRDALRPRVRLTPFLTGGQMSILGALLSSKELRYLGR